MSPSFNFYDVALENLTFCWESNSWINRLGIDWFMLIPFNLRDFLVFHNFVISSLGSRVSFHIWYYQFVYPLATSNSYASGAYHSYRKSMLKRQWFSIHLVSKHHFILGVKCKLAWHGHFIMFTLEVCIVSESDQVFTCELTFFKSHFLKQNIAEGYSSILCITDSASIPFQSFYLWVDIL